VTELTEVKASEMMYGADLEKEEWGTSGRNKKKGSTNSATIDIVGGIGIFPTNSRRHNQVTFSVLGIGPGGLPGTTGTTQQPGLGCVPEPDRNPRAQIRRKKRGVKGEGGSCSKKK